MTALDALWRSFCSPPDEARPRAWWHWMDGNVDPEGIRLDLDWLHRVGVRGVQMFDGGMGTPLVVPAKVHHGSREWGEAVKLAAGRASELRMEFAVATSAGWSAAGGPWVASADAMKKVVWSETRVEGGRSINQRLTPLPDVPGPYQDCPRWGADPDSPGRFAQDWAVVALPAAAIPSAYFPAAVEASHPVGDWGCIVDGGFSGSVSLPRDPGQRSSAWIEQVFDEPVTVAAVTVGLPGPKGFGSPPAAAAVLLASDDGVTYRTVATVDVPENPAAAALAVRTVSFPPVSARRFRLELTGESLEAAMPRLAEGVRIPPIMRPVSEFLVSEFALFAGGRVHQGELKAGFAAAPDYYALDTDEAATGKTDIDVSCVVDVTAFVDDQGVLDWEAPAGNWCILRFGASLTGQTNGPAQPDATGLEVDKMDAAKVRRYLDTYLGLFDAALGEERLDALLSDSIESGPQNFTDRLRERFLDLRGYDLLPLLPALAGYVVGDSSRSDRFLWDYRRTLADLISSEYYGTLSQEAHKRGMIYYAEALEDHRPQLGGDLSMRSHADVPMGAMWVFDAGTDEPKPTFIADLKGASSVAHIYGKSFTGAESMTALHRPWSYTPRRLKHVADLELALGVTRFCIHTSPHQPTQVPPPGIGLASVIGQTFIRTEPWAELARPWIDYLARCSWLLNQGTPAVDVAVFIGEEAPLTALFGEEPDHSVPSDFDFDYVDLEALECQFTARDNALVAGSTTYKVLYLGGSSHRMTARALRRLVALAESGVPIVGRRPESSPSLADDPGEFQNLREQLWRSPSVVDTEDLSWAMTHLGFHSGFVVEEEDVLRVGRRIASQEIYFVANPRPEPRTVTIRSTAKEPMVLWNPVTLRREALQRTDDGGTAGGGGRYRLELPALGSVFLVPGGQADELLCEAADAIRLDGRWHLSLPGTLETELPDGVCPWTDLGPESQAFAGVGTYSTTFEATPETIEGRALCLHVEDVGDIARVRINGTDCGIIWTHPWRLDVTAAVQPGLNTVEIEVANAWMNRLIAEAKQPSGEIFAPVAEVYEADAPMAVSGLTGPVVLLAFESTGSNGYQGSAR